MEKEKKYADINISHAVSYLTILATLNLLYTIAFIHHIILALSKFKALQTTISMCIFSLIGQKTLLEKEKMLVSSICIFSFFQPCFQKDFFFFFKVIKNPELFEHKVQKNAWNEEKIILVKKVANIFGTEVSSL